MTFAATAQSYPETTPSLDQVCRQEFGSNARLADWTDVLAFVQRDGSIAQLANTIAMTPRAGMATSLPSATITTLENAMATQAKRRGSNGEMAVRMTGKPGRAS